MADAHVILAEHPGYGWSIECPQLPELVGGRTTLVELYADLREILAFGGLRAGATVSIHEQAFMAADGGDEFAIRVARDDNYMNRLDVANAALKVLADPVGGPNLLEDYLDLGPDPVLTMCMYDDTVGWLEDQMDRRRFLLVLVVVAPMPDERPAVQSTALLVDGSGPDGYKTLADFGLGRNDTVGELLTRFSQSPNAQSSKVLLAL